MPNAAAEKKKGEGNEAFKRRDYDAAIRHYSEAIKIDPTNQIYFSNRSAAYGGKRDWTKAAEDGRKCIELDRTFIKGYHRLATALKELGQYKEAIDILRAGQKIEFDHADLKKLLLEVEPLLEQQEKSKRRSMAAPERLKEEGNDFFKEARFEKAIEKYTEALEVMPDKTSELAISCYNNRAACHQQLFHFQQVVEDCSHVLELDPYNQKALLRRGLAFEGLERYALALDDIRRVLAINPNIDMANKAQHRLGQAVRLQKEQRRG